MDKVALTIDEVWDRLGNGTLTINQARNALGYGRIPTGDVFLRKAEAEEENQDAEEGCDCVVQIDSLTFDDSPLLFALTAQGRIWKTCDQRREWIEMRLPPGCITHE